VIKAVFFDWFNTVARYDPPREGLYQAAFKEYGLDISLRDIHRGLMIGDQQVFSPQGRSLLKGKKFEDVPELFLAYPRAILTLAGKTLPEDATLRLIRTLLAQPRSSWALFDDAIPTCTSLRRRGLKLGVITNAEKGVEALAENLGLRAFLDFMVTSDMAGAEKPDARIFLAALDRAGVNAEEAIHIGDQYKIDVVGARGAGIHPVLIDRFDAEDGITDCPRISRLDELEQYL
jgi:putative hydrolase of the HAD superfamily